MKNIILQIAYETTKKYLEYYEANGIHDLADMSEALKVVSDEMAREVLCAFISFADKAVKDAREERMGDGIKIRESNVPRTLLTALGEFSYNRTYYDTPIGREYIIDNMLGVSAYERIDSGVSAKLVNHAAMYSYDKSAAIVTSGQTSRQSVKNKVMNTGEVVYLPERVKETPEAIHIFADEDHVNLQSGKNTIVPLVTICGGKKAICKGRNELNDPLHVQGYGLESETFWEYIYAVCAEKYDMKSVKAVYIYGDGAPWICGFKDVFPYAVHALDGFHFKKRMRGLFAGEICSKYNCAAYGAVGGNDKVLFDRIVQSMLSEVSEKMPDGKEKTGRMKAIMGNAGYIIRYWDEIQNMKIPGTIGSCTEAMISHVLSTRLSRNPMGWSKEGLSKMSMIRVFVLNGGKIEPKDTLAWKQSHAKNTVITEFEKYAAIVEKQQQEVLKDAKNWRWFETDDFISRKTTGTKVALDALGITRKVS